MLNYQRVSFLSTFSGGPLPGPGPQAPGVSFSQASEMTPERFFKEVACQAQPIIIEALRGVVRVSEIPGDVLDKL